MVQDLGDGLVVGHGGQKQGVRPGFVLHAQVEWILKKTTTSDGGYKLLLNTEFGGFGHIFLVF